MKIKKSFHYFYKITNKLNNHFYYGIHSTDDVEDGYMGSGIRLNYAYRKYGIENFEKEILHFFNTREEAAEYEAEVVTESLVRDENCYNIRLGGEKSPTLGMCAFKDKDGNIVYTFINDERVIRGELVGLSKGWVALMDKDGNWVRVTKDDERYKNGELTSPNKHHAAYKDRKGNIFYLEMTDERITKEGLVFVWEGRKHKKDTLEKMHQTHIKNQHQQGEKNSQYGTCWVRNDKENKKIKKDELENYLVQGWIKGRKMKFE